MTKVYTALRKVASFLTPEGRRAVYLVLGAVGAVATAFGFLSEAQVADYIGTAGHVLDVLAFLLAAAHVTPEGDAETGAEE